MIILFAMVNSLIARENSPRGPRGPPDCATRDVYAGDGVIWISGSERRRLNAFTGRDSVANNHPRRMVCGRKVVVLPYEHRHPENKAWLVAAQAAP
jgi:hypothetical protein